MAQATPKNQKRTIHRRRSVIAFAAVLLAVVAAAVFYYRKAQETPLYDGYDMAHWIREADSRDPSERYAAITVLSNTLGTIHDPGPKNCGPLGGLFDLSLRRELLRMHNSRVHIRTHLSKIVPVLERATMAQDVSTREAALRGLTFVGWWSGPAEMRRLLPKLISACYDQDQDVRHAAHRHLVNSLRCFQAFDDYKELPVKDLLPIVTAALARDELKFDAVVILGYMGQLADKDVLPQLADIAKQADTDQNRSLAGQARWAMERIRGTQ